MEKRFCILLTATLVPGTSLHLKRDDRQKREADYVNALRFYLQQRWRVVFCENSGESSAGLQQLLQQYPEQVEFLQFPSQKSKWGKGHGEKEIIDYAFAHSQFLKECEWVAKITGRLIVNNIDPILEALANQQFEVSGNLTRNLTWCDSRFVVFSKPFYTQYLEPALEQYLHEEKGIFFEHCVSRAIHRLLSEQKGFIPLPLYPEYTGVNATNNQRYHQGIWKKWKYKLYYRIKKYVLEQTI